MMYRDMDRCMIGAKRARSPPNSPSSGVASTSVPTTVAYLPTLSGHVAYPARISATSGRIILKLAFCVKCANLVRADCRRPTTFSSRTQAGGVSFVETMCWFDGSSYHTLPNIAKRKTIDVAAADL